MMYPGAKKLSAKEEHKLALSVERAELTLWGHLFGGERLKKRHDNSANMIRQAYRTMAAKPMAARKSWSRWQAARKKMMESNVRLVCYIASRIHRKYKIDYEDAVQEGMIGLARSVDKYEPSNGARFGAYAAWWIRQAIMRYAPEKNSGIRVPIHRDERILKIKKAKAAHRQKTGDLLGEEILAAQLGLTKSQVRENAASIQVVSMQKPHACNDGEYTLEGFLHNDVPTPEEMVAHRSNIEASNEAMLRLPEQYRRVLDMRYGLSTGESQTLQECGGHFGLSRERIRQIEILAIKRIREIMEGTDGVLGALENSRDDGII